MATTTTMTKTTNTITLFYPTSLTYTTLLNNVFITLFIYFVILFIIIIHLLIYLLNYYLFYIYLLTLISLLLVYLLIPNCIETPISMH